MPERPNERRVPGEKWLRGGIPKASAGPWSTLVFDGRPRGGKSSSSAA